MIQYQIMTNCRFKFENRIYFANKGMAMDINYVKKVLIKLANLPIEDYFIRMQEELDCIKMTLELEPMTTVGETVLKLSLMKDEIGEAQSLLVAKTIIEALVDAYKVMGPIIKSEKGSESDGES